MPRRPVRLLQAANILGALVLLAAAITHVAAGEWPQAVTATLITALLGEHAIREAEFAALQRARVSARLRVLATEKHTPAAAVIDEQLDPARRELAAACCIDSWVSRDRRHDPTHCNRERS